MSTQIKGIIVGKELLLEHFIAPIVGLTEDRITTWLENADKDILYILDLTPFHMREETGSIQSLIEIFLQAGLKLVFITDKIEKLDSAILNHAQVTII